MDILKNKWEIAHSKRTLYKENLFLIAYVDFA